MDLLEHLSQLLNLKFYKSQNLGRSRQDQPQINRLEQLLDETLLVREKIDLSSAGEAFDYANQILTLND